MHPSTLLHTLTLLLFPLALLSTTWLYLYPLFHACTFPVPPAHVGTLAPFRLLALGDPQLEGDTSLPDPNAPVFPSLDWLVQDLRHAPDRRTRVRIVRNAAKGVMRDTAAWAEGYRKRVDLWGNDWYLAHVVRQTRWWSGASHVAVLGDLLGSQWVGEGEFERRGGRYWGRVMRGLGRVPGVVYGEGERGGGDGEVEGEDGEGGKKNYWGGTTEVLGADPDWSTRVINIAGNHDIGYAGDIDEDRIARFERAFGRVNWDIWFTLPNTTTPHTEGDATATSTEASSVPALRLIILNSMNLDTPAYSSALQSETYSFLNHLITTARPVEDKTHATVLLTHIPLEKQPGICVDSPYFSYFDNSPEGVMEQNMLSGHSSRGILEGIFGLSENSRAAASGLGRNGIVLNGHDHEGCDVLHFVKQDIKYNCHIKYMDDDAAHWPAATPKPAPDMRESHPTSPSNPLMQRTCLAPPPRQLEDPEPEPAWHAQRFPTREWHIYRDNKTCTHIPSSPRLREITLRSMMGDFGGYAGFLSAWFDCEKGEDGEGEWVFEFATCGLGVQHWWWGVHILDLVFVVVLVGSVICKLFERGNGRTYGVKKPEKANGKM